MHPRNQNVWKHCVHHQLCDHERSFLHPKLVGHQKSRMWPHEMLGSCWHLPWKARAKTLSEHSQGGDRPKCSNLEHARRDFGDIYRRFGSPALVNFSQYAENKHGFMPLVDSWSDQAADLHPQTHQKSAQGSRASGTGRGGEPRVSG